ncbi:MAG: transposase [Chloroflexi bacterium]|nr:transposase [Chloroflexota bacterium]
MSKLEYQLFYRRNLPHLQPPGATIFITFRLANSIPIFVLEQLAEEARQVEVRLARINDLKERTHQASLARRQAFGKWDKAMDLAHEGPFWLREPQIASLVAESLRHRDGQVYDLLAFCIMPNHAHLVCTPLRQSDDSYYALSEIMHSLKRYTARQANLLLCREGDFWQHENYDHVVRNEEELSRIINYVLDNPIKAGFAQNREDWKWSYCKAN